MKPSEEYEQETGRHAYRLESVPVRMESGEYKMIPRPSPEYTEWLEKKAALNLCK